LLKPLEEFLDFREALGKPFVESSHEASEQSLITRARGLEKIYENFKAFCKR
jgi:hypothetical protein